MTTLVALPDPATPETTLPSADGDKWTLSGQPLRDPGLRRQILNALNQVSDLGAGVDLAQIDTRDFSSVDLALTRGHDYIINRVRLAAQRSGKSNVADLVDLMLDVERLRIDVMQARTTQQLGRYASVQTALARLRGIGTVAQMMQRAPAELCRCGFDRVILSRVQDSVWHVEACHIEGDPDWAQEIVRVGREQSQTVGHMLLESEMMRRRAPMLVRDAQHDPRTHGPIGAASLSRSYVAAPIMPEGRVIGFLHADCYQSHRDVDDDDCALLWLFAEGFGYAFQRTVLLERLRGLRDDVQQMSRSMASKADDVCGAETQLASDAGRSHTSGDGAASATLSEPQSRIESLLSKREIEVLELMAMGQTNGEIATHLTISEGTVKSHVKHILRKTRAANRAEAVFRYMRLTAANGTSHGVL